MQGLRLGLAVLGLIQLVTLAAATVEARPARGGRDRAEESAAAPLRQPDGPLQIVISIGSQRLWVYDNQGLLETSIVSTGVGGFPTPTGVFAVLDKEPVHYSNIYRGASMPFMQRLTMSGVALHSGMVTGRPASHGCIRLPHAFAIKLFRITRLGTRVIIAPNAPEPAEIAHPRLFVRQPPPAVVPEAPPETEAARAAEASGLDLERGVATSRIYQVTAARNALLDTLPVSVFVSRAEGKVLVRHAFRPLFDAPVIIRDPERPFGTHIFTAAEAKDGGTEMRWLAVSILGGTELAAGTSKVSRVSLAQADPAAATELPASAAEALDRVELPPEAVERISQMLSPGATLIISDHGLNRELRESGTDFIVLTR